MAQKILHKLLVRKLIYSGVGRREESMILADAVQAYVNFGAFHEEEPGAFDDGREVDARKYIILNTTLGS